METLISCKYVAKVLGVSISTINRWSEIGKINFTTTNCGHKRYKLSDLNCNIDLDNLKVNEVVENDKKYCKCGCGIESPKATRNWNKKGIKKGQYLDYICGHHRRGKRQTKDEKIKRAMSRHGKQPIFSPFLPGNKVIYFHNHNKRWYCHSSNGPHAKEVYRHYKGEVPNGMEVHHKNGTALNISDDNINNLMLVPKIWNWNFLPYLSKGFGVSEEIVTNAYVNSLNCSNNDIELFRNVCKILLKETN